MNRENHNVDLAPPISLAAGNHNRPTWGTILHPTDYSAASRQAFELACRIARDRGSRLVVMHVAEPVRISSLGWHPCPHSRRGTGGRGRVGCACSGLRIPMSGSNTGSKKETSQPLSSRTGPGNRP